MYTVYLVEDNSADVELFRLALDTAGANCELKVFADGREIVDYVQQQNRPAPDLIVLDLNLPKLDGLEVLQLIRANPAFANVRVAALSSSSSPRDQRKLSELNVAAYLVKPSDLDEYMKIGTAVRNLLP
jgi:CheY-like chemotaxis protein